MISDKFKLNFNFGFNIFLISILFLGSFVWADTTGIWHEASDVRGGTFGNAEQDVTASSGYTFINQVIFSGNIVYKGVELDTKYVNENQANSINSAMITDGTITSSDVNFNYATSDIKGGNAITSNSCNGDSYCEMNSAIVAGRWFVTAHGSAPLGGVGMFGSYNSGVGSGIGIIQVYDYSSGSSKNLVIQSAGGNVGIETSDPTSKLDVNGDIRVRTKADCGKLYTDSSGNVLCGVDANTLADADSDPTNEIQTVTLNGGLQRDGSNNFGVMNCPVGQVLKSNGVNSWGCGADSVGLSSEVDGSISNEIQTISKSGTDITLSNNGGTVSINDTDADPANEKPLAGTGISVSDRTVSVNTAAIQNRVSGTCAVGSYIRTINTDGTVVCGTDSVGLLIESDPTITQPNVKDGVSWSEIGSIPAGFLDGVDSGCTFGAESGWSACTAVALPCGGFISGTIQKTRTITCSGSTMTVLTAVDYCSANGGSC